MLRTRLERVFLVMGVDEMSREVFERNNEGSYRVRGLVRPEEIVAMASSILLHDLRGKKL